MTDYDKDILFEPDPDKDEAGFLKALRKHYEHKRGDLRGIHFPPNFEPRTELPGISDNTYPGILKLTGAVFNGLANFEYITFERPAHLQKAEFRAGASFEGATFSGPSFFNKSVFGKDGFTSFNGATFEGKASFQEADFKRDLYFLDTTFESAAFFSRCYFRSDVHFQSSRVLNQSRVSFAGSKFFSESSFARSNFTGKADFSRSCFISKVSFDKSDFGGQALFTKGCFLGGEEPVVFKESDFFGGASFNQSTFRTERVSFFNSNIGGVTSFVGRSNSPIFSEADNVDFRQVTLSSADSLSFINVDLSNTQFLGTTLRGVEFVGSKWARVPYSVWGFQAGKRNAVHDEQRLSEGPGSSSRLEKLYRDLKQNFENRSDYARAGDFHFGEKETWRRSDSTHWTWKCLLTLYKITSCYSERAWPAALLLLLVTLTSSLAYLDLGISASGDAPLTWCIENWFSVLRFSTETSLLLGASSLQPQNLGSWLYIIHRITAPLLIGLWALAIRQRMRR